MQSAYANRMCGRADVLNSLVLNVMSANTYAQTILKNIFFFVPSKYDPLSCAPYILCFAHLQMLETVYLILSIWLCACDCMSVYVCCVCVVPLLLYAHNFSFTIFYNKKKTNMNTSCFEYTFITCTLCAISKTGTSTFEHFPFHCEAIAHRLQCMKSCSHKNNKNNRAIPRRIHMFFCARMYCLVSTTPGNSNQPYRSVCQWAHKHVSRKKKRRGKRTNARTRVFVKNHDVDLVDSREKPYPMVLSYNCLNIFHGEIFWKDYRRANNKCRQGDAKRAILELTIFRSFAFKFLKNESFEFFWFPCSV